MTIKTSLNTILLALLSLGAQAMDRPMDFSMDFQYVDEEAKLNPNAPIFPSPYYSFNYGDTPGLSQLPQIPKETTAPQTPGLKISSQPFFPRQSMLYFSPIKNEEPMEYEEPLDYEEPVEYTNSNSDFSETFESPFAGQFDIPPGFENARLTDDYSKLPLNDQGPQEANNSSISWNFDQPLPLAEPSAPQISLPPVTNAWANKIKFWNKPDFGQALPISPKILKTEDKPKLNSDERRPWRKTDVNPSKPEATHYFQPIEYEYLYDYAEGQHYTGSNSKFPNLVFIGKLWAKKKYLRTLKNHRIEFDADEDGWKGVMLNPERMARQNIEPGWEPIKNVAFMAGAIEKGKVFHLVTPLTRYANSWQEVATGTRTELFWLAANGYQFCYDDDGLVWAFPEPHRAPGKPKMVRHSNISRQDLLETMQGIREACEKAPKGGSGYSQKEYIKTLKPKVEAVASRQA